MVEDDEKIERARQPRRDADTRGHRLAAGETLGILWPSDVADHARIGGIGRMEMGVAQEHPVGTPYSGEGKYSVLSIAAGCGAS